MNRLFFIMWGKLRKTLTIIPSCYYSSLYGNSNNIQKKSMYNITWTGEIKSYCHFGCRIPTSFRYIQTVSTRIPFSTTTFCYNRYKIFDWLVPPLNKNVNRWDGKHFSFWDSELVVAFTYILLFMFLVCYIYVDQATDSHGIG